MPLVDVTRRALTIVAMVGLAVSTTGAKRPAPDKAAPVITHAAPGACPAAVGGVLPPCAIEAVIVDASGVFAPTLLVRLHGVQAYDRVPMRLVAGQKDTYSAVVPPGLAAAGVVEYLIEAFDVQGNGPARLGEEAAPLLLARAKVPTVTPPPPPPTLPPPTPAPEDNTGLIVGVAVGIGAAVLVGAGFAVAVYALRPAAPSKVALTVTAPAPIAGALGAP